MKHVEQQSHGRTTHAKTAATRLTTFKNRASLVRADKTLYDVRTNGRAFDTPVRARGLSRECVLRIPSVIVKGDIAIILIAFGRI